MDQQPPADSRSGDKAAQRDARMLQVVSILKGLAASAGNRGDKAAKARLLAEMESLVRDYVTRHPADAFLVAFTLLQERRVDEALTIAEECWPKADVNALAGESSALIAYPDLTLPQMQRLERILLSIADKKSRPVPLLLVLGDLYMRLRPRDAVEIYREVLKRNANDVVALNNLALLLACRSRMWKSRWRWSNRRLPSPARWRTFWILARRAARQRAAAGSVSRPGRRDPGSPTP